MEDVRRFRRLKTPPLFSCLHKKCANRVILIENLALTCETDRCMAFVRDIPLDIKHQVGLEYVRIINEYLLRGPSCKDVFLTHRKGLQDTLNAAYETTKTTLCSITTSKTSKTSDDVNDIKINLVIALYRNKVTLVGRDIWEDMGWPLDEYDEYISTLEQPDDAS